MAPYLQENDCHRDDPEKRPHRRMFEVISRVEPVNHNFEDISARIYDFLDVISIVAVPPDQCRKRYRTAILRSRARRPIRSAVGWLQMSLHGRVMRTTLDNSLESKRIEVHAAIFEFNRKDMS